MDKIAQRLSEWFGSSPFIFFHVVWFTLWVALHLFAKFDPDWATLTLIVSLEAIFLSLFILRAANIDTRRQTRDIKRILRKL